MPTPSSTSEPARPAYRRWLQTPLIVLAALVVLRLLLELAGVSHDVTRFFSSTGFVLLVALYLGAVAPLYGVRKAWQLIVPGIVVAAWLQLWVILATLLSGGLGLARSHFAEPEDYGNWTRLGHHVLGHLIEIIPGAIVALVLMATVLVLWRWPVIVAPGAVLGGLVMIRFWSEAMDLSPTASSAWSSSVGILLAALYLGGMASRGGSASFRALGIPSLVLGWTWRLWIFIAALMSAASPFYKTHFFDPSQGEVGMRLVRFLGGEVIVAGLVAGLLVWGIAAWVVYALRPLRTS